MKRSSTRRLCFVVAVFTSALWNNGQASSQDISPVKFNVSSIEHQNQRSVLAVHAQYPDLFRDPSGKPLLLVGSYGWGMFSNSNFDYAAMLDTLQNDGLNFARVWLFWGDEVLTDIDTRTGKPLHNVVPYLRTGPGNANDGRPKYDLTRFNPIFFERLRDVCQQAQDRGIYLQLCIFDGWLLKTPRWRDHVYHVDNNINGVDGDPKRTGRGRDNDYGFASLKNSAAMKHQQALIRQVVDTVNDFDHIFFEIANENANPQWELFLCNYLHKYEQSKPKQHLVMPSDIPNHGLGVIQTWDPHRLNAGLLAKRSRRKPQIFDTDWVISRNDNQIRKAMWAGIISGAHFDYLDASFQPGSDHNGDFRGSRRAELRKQIGNLAAFTRQIRFWEMSPDTSVVSKGDAVAFSSANELAIYLPAGGDVALDLDKLKRPSESYWCNPRTGVWKPAKLAAQRVQQSFAAPDKNDWLLYIRNFSDAKPPRVPTAVFATAQSATSVRVKWTASPDNVGTAWYQIFRNGQPIATTAGPGYVDSRLQPQTSYSYTVVAYDLSANQSAPSNESAHVVTPKQQTSYRVALGSQIISTGLSLLSNRDGDTKAATIDGAACRLPSDKGDEYFYFSVDNDHLFDEPGTTLFLKVIYYDIAGLIEPQFDSVTSRYANTQRLSLTGTKTWKTAYWTLTDARFADRQNAGADFRLFVGAAPVPIKSVEVSRVPFSQK